MKPMAKLAEDDAPSDTLVARSAGGYGHPILPCNPSLGCAYLLPTFGSAVWAADGWLLRISRFCEDDPLYKARLKRPQSSRISNSSNSESSAVVKYEAFITVSVPFPPKATMLNLVGASSGWPVRS